MAERTELQELVDDPNETLDVEYKSWINLRDNETRADLARHIAALSNYGGGRLVFGFRDDLKFAGVNPYADLVIDRDLVAGIVRRYLEPTVHCDVRPVPSAAGNGHPVIIVPPHGAAPICAKADGPAVDGTPRGIKRGTYYTRKPGPESAPITTPSEWAPIIRRCAMHERSAILGALDAALRGGTTPLLTDENSLKRWHDAARRGFLHDLARIKGFQESNRRYWHFSYMIRTEDGERLDVGRLIAILREVNNEVRELVSSGWSMFYPFTRKGIEPEFVVDSESGQGEAEFVECALLRDPQPVIHASDTWRVAPNGYATLIRPYWEDDPDLVAHTGLQAGTWFSPQYLARTLAEFVRHARGLARRYAVPTAVTFRCEWNGLRGRRFYHPTGLWMIDYVARSDQRVASETFPIGALESEWPDVVARLAAPLVRVFTNSWVMTPEWILGLVRTWRA